MKFDNFVKYAGSNGTIFEVDNGDKWLYYDHVGMKIPQGRNVCGSKPLIMPEYMKDLIYKYDDYEDAELTAAYVPDKYSKPSELMRTFSDGELSIDLYNKAFGFIEKNDRTFINSVYEADDRRYTALLVGAGYGDDLRFKMIYLESEDI